MQRCMFAVVALKDGHGATIDEGVVAVDVSVPFYGGHWTVHQGGTGGQPCLVLPPVRGGSHRLHVGDDEIRAAAEQYAAYLSG
jgi:hypothetical protein